jgi:hypothetical protein
MDKEKVAGQWDKADIILPDDVTVSDDHQVRLNEKGALRVTIRLMVKVLADSDGRELTQDEKLKVVGCLKDVSEVMKG